jgi:hypothetical protein
LLNSKGGFEGEKSKVKVTVNAQGMLHLLG